MTDQALDKPYKKVAIAHNLLSIAVAIVAAVSAGYAFYYTTSDTLDTHSKDIQTIQQDIKSLQTENTNSAIFKSTSDVKLHGLEDRLTKIEATQIRMEDKQDKVLEMLSTIRNNTSK